MMAIAVEFVDDVPSVTQAQKRVTRFPKRTRGRKLLRTSPLVFGNLRQSSGIVGSLWKSSDEIMRNCLKMTENSLIY